MNEKEIVEKLRKLIKDRDEMWEVVSHHTCAAYRKQIWRDYETRIQKLKNQLRDLDKKSPAPARLKE